MLKNHKMLMREIKDLSKCRDTPYSWIGIPNIEKMSIFPKLIYTFNAVPISAKIFCS